MHWPKPRVSMQAVFSVGKCWCLHLLYSGVTLTFASITCRDAVGLIYVIITGKELGNALSSSLRLRSCASQALTRAKADSSFLPRLLATLLSSLCVTFVENTQLSLLSVF